MSNKNILLSLCLCLFEFVNAQTNLVVDGSFEEATAHTNGSYYFFSLSKWSNPNNLSPDYYNDLDSYVLRRPSYKGGGFYQPPKQGNGLVGLFAIQQNFPNTTRDYAQGTFTEPLKTGKTYEVKFYVSLVNNTRVAVKHIGAYLSAEPITFTFRCELEPQIESNTILSDTLNWMEIKGEYIAQGGEKHITLGNFRDDKQSDTLVLPVGVNVSSLLHSYYYIDDVSVICLDCPIDEIGVGIAKTQQKTEIKIYPNPSSTNVNIALLTKTPQKVIVNIYNILGEQMQHSVSETNGAVVSFNTNNYTKGIYIVKVTNADGEVLEIKKIMVSHE